MLEKELKIERKLTLDEERFQIVQEIIKNRHKILDDFSRAYLAENLKDVPIRDLVLVERQLPSTREFEMQGYTYWFERKEKG